MKPENGNGLIPYGIFQFNGKGLILIADYPEFSDLITYPALFKVFDVLGFADTRFSSGYIISKPEQSPALFWHQDWWGWGDPISYTDQIAQVFVMILSLIHI